MGSGGLQWCPLVLQREKKTLYDMIHSLSMRCMVRKKMETYTRKYRSHPTSLRSLLLLAPQSEGHTTLDSILSHRNHRRTSWGPSNCYRSHHAFATRESVYLNEQTGCASIPWLCQWMVCWDPGNILVSVRLNLWWWINDKVTHRCQCAKRFDCVRYRVPLRECLFLLPR